MPLATTGPVSAADSDSSASSGAGAPTSIASTPSWPSRTTGWSFSILRSRPKRPLWRIAEKPFSIDVVRSILLPLALPSSATISVGRLPFSPSSVSTVPDSCSGASVGACRPSASSSGTPG